MGNSTENNVIKVTRQSTESKIEIALDFNGTKKEYRKDINTPIVFLNHMIEHIAWRGGVNIKIDLSLDKFNLAHVVCEDLGIAFGKAVAEHINRNRDYGIMGYGDAFGIIDEAKAHCAMSFESRAHFDFTTGMEIIDCVEEMASDDLTTFLEGFAQGALCAIHLDIIKGSNAHHIWEAAFRAVGSALCACTAINPKREGMTSGVAGKIEFIIE